MNKISRLKVDGQWVSDEAILIKHIVDYFGDLFKGSSSRNFDDILTAVPRCITPDMNAQLCKPMIDDEIRDAVLQLGDLKALGPDGFSDCFF